MMLGARGDRLADSGAGAGGGARAAQSRRSSALRGWLKSHASHVRGSLQRLVSQPLQSAMTILVIAIALALPAALMIGVMSLQQLGGGWQSSSRVNVYVTKGANAAQVQALVTRVAKTPGVAEVTLVSPEAALAEFQEISGFGDALDMLEGNPLPPVLIIGLETAMLNSVDQLDDLTTALGQYSHVDEVQLDMAWLMRLQQVLETARRVAMLLGVTLGLGVLLIVGNTIRLAVENRREEIVVVKLVGGTNAFVRRPFLYTGVWYGLFGALAAWIGLTAGGWWLDDSIARLGELYQADIRLVRPGVSGLLVMTAGGALLGLFGAALAAGRHIAQVEP